MTNQPDVPRRSEKTWIAVSVASQGPWAVALAGGAIVGAADLGLHVLTGHLTVATPLSVAVAMFFLIGAGGALLRRGYDRARSWAQRHPWSYASVPAAATAVTVFGVRLVLSASGPFDAAWHGLWSGAWVLLLLGLIGYVARGVRPAR
jgi:hypothetical protein